MPNPLFIDGPTGRLFSVFHPPEGPGGPGGEAVLYLPPFAEEMNRSRRMAALMARALAREQIGCLILDPFGTGDSGGDFSGASWEIWRTDAAAAAEWLKERGFSRISLLGLRLGACLALDVASNFPVALPRILLWQPVANGKTFLNQFLRIRVAMGLAETPEGPPKTTRETTKILRQRLDDGETLEVAGYALTPNMAQAIEGLRLAQLGQDCGCPIHWLNVGAGDDGELPPAAKSVLGHWAQTGVQVKAETVRGEAFWTIEETTLAPDLVSATVRLFTGEVP